MSTRGIISLQKGNRVRYCFVANDTNQLYKSIMEMKFEEIESTYNGMCVLDSLKRTKKPQLICRLVRLQSDREFKDWIGYSIADYLREKLDKKELKMYQHHTETVNGHQFTGQDLYAHVRVRCILSDQPTANIPVVIQVNKVDFRECGSFEIDHTVGTQGDAINHHRPFFGCENICYYNLDTGIVSHWHGGELTFTAKKVDAQRRGRSIWPKLKGFKLSTTELKNLVKKFVV